MIYYTVKDPTKHVHLVYISNKVINDPLTGQSTTVVGGTTSDEMGHTHLVSAGENGVITILPASIGKKAPHTHEISQDEVGSNDSDLSDADEIFDGKSDEEIVGICRKMFDEADKIEELSRKNGEESERFYKGEQWTPEDKQKLYDEDRVALTVNEIQSKIDLLSGFQAQSATDVRLFPVEAGDKEVAEILTMVIKNIFDKNRMNRIESETFLDEVIVGRGLYSVYVDYNRNPLGDIIIEKLNWRDCYFAQHDKFDLNDCDYVVKVKCYPKNKLIRMFPDKAEEITKLSDISQMTANVKYSSDYVKKAPGQLDENIINYNLSDIDSIKQTIKVYELWHKQFQEKFTVVSYDDGQMKEYTKLSKSVINKLEKMGLSVLRRVITSMKVIKYTGNILLSKEDEDTDNFSVIPVYAKHIGGDFFGKVEPAKDVQREINKRTSNAIDVINKMSSYVYYYDNNTFADQKDEVSFRENAMKPGAIFKVNEISKRPVKDTGINMPSELVNMMSIASNKMNVILNIPQEAQGFASREISSVSLVETRRSTLQANEFLYSNLADAKKLLTKIIIGMIQKVYTPERILRIIRSNEPPKTQEEADKRARQDKAIEDIFSTPDLRDYDIAVELSPTSPTVRSANFALSLELLKNGFPIPPETVIEMSDFSNKEEILAKIQGNKQQAQEAEQAKVDSEIAKTQTAAQAKIQVAQLKAGGGRVAPQAPVAPQGPVLPRGQF